MKLKRELRPPKDVDKFYFCAIGSKSVINLVKSVVKGLKHNYSVHWSQLKAAPDDVLVNIAASRILNKLSAL